MALKVPYATKDPMATEVPMATKVPMFGLVCDLGTKCDLQHKFSYSLSYFLNALVKQQPVEIKVSVDAFIIAQ